MSFIHDVLMLIGESGTESSDQNTFKLISFDIHFFEQQLSGLACFYSLCFKLMC